VDLAETEALPGWMKQLAAEHGPLSGVVHSAGIHAMRPVRFQSTEQFEEIQRINVTAALALSKGFRQKQVRTESGSLVFVASVMGLVAQPGVTAYCASKGALLSLTRSLALELAAEQIRVNAVAPGQVLTEMTLRQKEQLPADHFAAIEKMHPLGLGKPEDVANGITFLLSDAARWITGITLTIDGGYTAA
jgi:NAD(P)-dependent dehydrogenase (short-subunit alcohol dehydrogenase family)